MFLTSSNAVQRRYGSSDNELSTAEKNCGDRDHSNRIRLRREPQAHDLQLQFTLITRSIYLVDYANVSS